MIYCRSVLINLIMWQTLRFFMANLDFVVMYLCATGGAMEIFLLFYLFIIIIIVIILM